MENSVPLPREPCDTKRASAESKLVNNKLPRVMIHCTKQLENHWCERFIIASSEEILIDRRVMPSYDIVTTGL